MWQILSKFSRETEIDSECVCVCVCVCVYTGKHLLWGIGFHDYGNWETRESQWWNPIWIPEGLRARGMGGVNPSPRAREDRCSSSSSQVGSKRQEIRLLFVLFFFFLNFFICSEFCHTLKWKGLGFTCSFLFYSGLQWIEWCPFTLQWVIYFTESTDSNANLICASQTHPEIMSNLGSPWPSQVDTKS